jgi:putative CRISPR-associated protein (TIGR02619 family)
VAFHKFIGGKKLTNTLIATVGASLLGNINRNEELKVLYENNKIDELTDKLLDPKIKIENERSLGAEINSIESIIREGYLEERKNLYCLISDTETGRKIGEILERYFKESKESSFENVVIKTTEKLDDQKKEDFKRYGLRNLVKNMSEILIKHGSSTIINATGGYKAQMAFALALGQGMNIPVYYQFERFPAVIKMPPLPLSLDYRLYTDYLYFIDQFDEEGFMEYTDEIKNQYKTIDEKLIPLFSIERLDNKKYIELNPMGQVYVESAKSFFNLTKKQEITLKKRKNDFIFQSSNSEGHSKEIISEYKIDKKFEELDFVERVYVKGSSPTEKSGRKNKVKIFGEELKVSIHTKKGILDLGVQTTAKNNEEQILAKQKIYEFINNNFSK